jgi:hypothetical protein
VARPLQVADNLVRAQASLAQQARPRHAGPAQADPGGHVRPTRHRALYERERSLVSALGRGSWTRVLVSPCVRAAQSLGGSGVVRRQDDEVGVALLEPQNHG